VAYYVECPEQDAGIAASLFMTSVVFVLSRRALDHGQLQAEIITEGLHVCVCVCQIPTRIN